MSHVFISYAHGDQDKYQVLDKFVGELKKVGFTDDDIWYDKNIDTGSRWHVEIDTALEEAFAVVVLLGPAAMESAYVTYEWSWAIGNGTPLFPLVMEGGDYDKMHGRLRVDVQCTDCREFMPPRLMTNLIALKQDSPLSKALKFSVGELTQPIHSLLNVLFWLHQYQRDYYDEFQFIVEKSGDEALVLFSKKLTDFWLQRSSAFTTKQRRMYEMLIYSVEKAWRILRYYNLAVRDKYDDYSRLTQELHQHYSDTLRPAIEFFVAKNAAQETISAYLSQQPKFSLPDKGLKPLAHAKISSRDFRALA